MSDCPSLNSWYTAGYRRRKSGQWPRVVWRRSRHRPCTGETARVLGQTLAVLRTQATRRPMSGHGTSACCLELRNDLSHSSTGPPSPNEVPSLCNRMLWSTVSNAALRSRRRTHTWKVVFSNCDRVISGVWRCSSSRVASTLWHKLY